VTVRVLTDLRSPMLLLDSRSARVTATCLARGRHPLLRTYGTNLPNSLTSVIPTGRALLWQSTCVGSRYEYQSPFSRALGDIDLRYLEIRSLRAITASTNFLDSTGRRPGSMMPKASVLVIGSTGILTSYPFDPFELRGALGSTNPWLIDSAKEPLLFWPSGFTPDFRCYCD
jgi:hypothetical protein